MMALCLFRQDRPKLSPCQDLHEVVGRQRCQSFKFWRFPQEANKSVASVSISRAFILSPACQCNSYTHISLTLLFFGTLQGSDPYWWSSDPESNTWKTKVHGKQGRLSGSLPFLNFHSNTLHPLWRYSDHFISSLIYTCLTALLVHFQIL